jgi:hypothetical protein
MSWQSYVDTNLVGSGQITAAGIYDLVGNPWAYSAGFAVRARAASTCPLPALASPRRALPPTREPPAAALSSPQAQVAEVAAVAAAMLADPTVLAGTGVMCAGQKYMFVRGDSEEVYAKKVRSPAEPARCLPA